MSAEQYEKEVGSLNEHDEAVRGIVEFPVKPAWDMLTVDPETREYILRDFGTVEHNGKTLILTEQAYMDNYGTDGAVRYYAHAIDDEGNTYRVAWDTTAEHDMACELAILEGREEMREKYGDELSEADAKRLAELREMNLPDPSDESIACDWSEPAEVKAV